MIFSIYTHTVGLVDVKEILKRNVMLPIKHPEVSVVMHSFCHLMKAGIHRYQKATQRSNIIWTTWEWKDNVGRC